MFIIIFLVSLFLTPNFVHAQWDDCRFDQTDCQYPGSCGQYTDTNNDLICDHSQQKPSTTTIKDTTIPVQSKNTPTDRYNVILINTLVLGFYSVTFFLSQKNIITKPKHRMIWNIILTINFLLTAITGVVLAINISFAINLNLPANFLFLHVETGLVFSLVSIFHIFWHLPYYKAILTRSI